MSRYYSDMVNMRTCVYRFFNADNELMYVGISMNFNSRLNKHRQRDWWPLVTRIEIEWHQGRESAKAAERAAIADEKPIYNRARPPHMPPILITEVGA